MSTEVYQGTGAGDDSKEKNLRLTVRGLLVWLVVSVLSIFCHAAGFLSASPTLSGLTKLLTVFSNGALLAVAFSGMGGLLGFLFGIPRTQQDVSSSAQSGRVATSASDASAYRLAVNTNLEQISDWLTKIIVGVGLTQLIRMPGKLVQLAEYFKGALNDNATFALVLILNFLVFGFFAGYLLTRLFLAGAFSEADQAAARLRSVVQVATMLTDRKDYVVAAATLENSLNEIRPDTPKDAKKRVYEELTYNYLYKDPPEGFQKAIQYGRKYIDEEPATPSARIWVNLAAAYGQQYKWELERDKRPAASDESKRNALNAVKEALRLEPRMKGLLRMLWDPKDATKVSNEEDDLEVFYEDPDFRKILGE